jgi:hypothetical protein
MSSSDLPEPPTSASSKASSGLGLPSLANQTYHSSGPLLCPDFDTFSTTPKKLLSCNSSRPSSGHRNRNFHGSTGKPPQYLRRLGEVHATNLPSSYRFRFFGLAKSRSVRCSSLPSPESGGDCSGVIDEAPNRAVRSRYVASESGCTVPVGDLATIGVAIVGLAGGYAGGRQKARGDPGVAQEETARLRDETAERQGQLSHTRFEVPSHFKTELPLAHLRSSVTARSTGKTQPVAPWRNQEHVRTR